MASTVGYEGAVKYGADSSENYIAGVQTLSVNLPRDMLDDNYLAVTTSPSPGKRVLPGMYQMTVDLNMHVDGSDTAQAALVTNWTAGTAASLLIDFDAVSTFTAQIDCATMYVSNISFGITPDGIETMDVSLVSTGAITVAI